MSYQRNHDFLSQKRVSSKKLYVFDPQLVTHVRCLLPLCQTKLFPRFSPLPHGARLTTRGATISDEEERVSGSDAAIIYLSLKKISQLADYFSYGI
jgi:hypothetical protein